MSKYTKKQNPTLIVYNLVIILSYVALAQFWNTLDTAQFASGF